MTRFSTAASLDWEKVNESLLVWMLAGPMPVPWGSIYVMRCFILAMCICCRQSRGRCM